jgi:lipase maturation factor 1
MDRLLRIHRWLFDSGFGARDRLIPRWIFLRALGLIYFSAFFSLFFQIRGLIGPDGILPAKEYLKALSNQLGPPENIWYAPTLLWLSGGNHMLLALCWVGMIASVLLVANIRPRAMLAMCFLCFLSFVSAAQDFSGYQSDGMLLEAGFISLFFAPTSFRPGLGAASPPSRASLFLLLWEWFRIYFESGLAKILGGDPEWRHFTAMDEYYQNGPLPTWIGWYVQHLPHWFHYSTAVATIVLELGLVWMLFLPRRWRIVCFFIVTPWEIGVILTANYTFLNYLVLGLGFLLLHDHFLQCFIPPRWKRSLPVVEALEAGEAPKPSENEKTQAAEIPQKTLGQPGQDKSRPAEDESLFLRSLNVTKLSLASFVLLWIFYDTTAELIGMFSQIPLPMSPVMALEPFRIANRYGLFGIMTRGRYEIEFQGSNDATNWVAYPFRFKPQELNRPPGIYAPYQPRFDWNLWFASLGQWQQYPIVLRTEVKLLDNDRAVLGLFRDDPFPNQPPREVRAVLWQYWFTTISEKHRTGLWWRREFVGLYAPALEREPDGKIQAIEMPTVEPRE